MLKSLLVSALLIALSAPLLFAQSSADIPANWNSLNANEQARWFNERQRQRICAATPGACQAPAVDQGAVEARRFNERQAQRIAPQKPADWNLMGSHAQAAWLCRNDASFLFLCASTGAVGPVTAGFRAGATPDRPRCGRACGEPWTAADFEASRREIERLERSIAQSELYLGQRARAQAAAPSYQPYVPPPVYRPYVPPPAPAYAPTHSTTTALRGSSTTFYSGSNGVTGTSTSIPPFEFYNFSNGASATATTIKPFTFYDFTNPRGKTTTGTTTTIGQFDFHNFSNGVNGTSTTIGGTTFHNFSNGKTCTTQTIGASTFTNCY